MESLPVRRFGGSGFTEDLAPDPRSVSRARRLVAGALEGAGHEDLVEVASLLVSEVVTNAVLHAGTPIRLGCSWSPTCVRVEVHDDSSVLPTLRHYDAEATTGRGLGLVEKLAAAWGVEARPPGKMLWFELGGGDDRTSPRREDVPTGTARPGMTVQLLDVSPALLIATVMYGDAILREAALLSFGGEAEGLIPGGWHIPQFDVAPLLAAAQAAIDTGRDRVDLTLELPESARETSLERMRLIDRVDEMARREVLLIQPALPEVAACRHWLYSQIHEQSSGAPPKPWRLPEPRDPAAARAALSPDQLRYLLASTAPTVAADDANRIVWANEGAGALLGWDPEALVGQRLTVVIPPELREAHLAGFSRLQMTGKSRILDRPVEVAALRSDGSRVEVVLTVRRLQGKSRRRVFQASIEPRFTPDAPG